MSGRSVVRWAVLCACLGLSSCRSPSEIPETIEKELETLRAFDAPGAAYQYYAAQRSGPQGHPVDVPGRYRSALEHMGSMPRHSLRLGRRLPSKKDAPPKRPQLRTWEPLGPGNVGGRTRALLIHPENPDTLIAGGVSGGVWKTTDGGASWRAVADMLPNIAVNSMAMDPFDPDIIYAGTGEGYFREIVRGTALPLRGEGIFKSVDGGESWQRLESTANADFHWVNDLAVSSLDPRRVYAATRTGVWASQDGGASWTRLMDRSDTVGGCFRLALRSDRPSDELLASCGTFQQATVYRTIAAESGFAFVPVLSEPQMGLTSLALAPSNQNIVYALSAHFNPGANDRFHNGLHAVFRSASGGAANSWQAVVRNTDPDKVNTLILTNPVIASLETCFGDQDRYSTLGWYTNMIAVDPVDPDIVWAGGVDLFRSDDGGRSWGPVSHWFQAAGGSNSPDAVSAHADQHVIAFHPGYDGEENQTFFLGNDGGVYRTDNARAPRSTEADSVCDMSNSQVAWARLNHDYGVTQFYHGAAFPDGRAYLGGTQDNGTQMSSDEEGPNGWRSIFGGDGGYVAVDPDDTDILYVEFQGLNLQRSMDGGGRFQSITQGITESRANFLFIVPFLLDPNDSRRLWIGGNQLWRTPDRGETWQAASAPFESGGSVSAIAVASGDSNRALAGLDDGWIHRRADALSSTASDAWQRVQPREGFVTWLAFDPNDPDVAYATYANFGGTHVWKSQDAGASWAPLDGQGEGALPDIPAHSILVDPGNSRRLFLGTDLGVFVSTDGGTTWEVEETGFATALTESLQWVERPGQAPLLFAFTHGRGAWRVEVRDQGAPASCQPERWIVHVTPPDVPFTTTILASNFADAPAQVELVPFHEDGLQLDPLSWEVAAGGATRIEPSQEAFGPAEVSHFGICAPASVSVSAAYRFDAETGASAHVPETTIQGTSFLLYAGEYDIVFDGMAAINQGDAPARIEAALLTLEGEEVGRATLADALDPGAKALSVLDAQFIGLSGDLIRLESDQPITPLLLRGSRPDTGQVLLYQTVPVPVGDDLSECAEPELWIPHVTPADSGFDTHLLATNNGAQNAILTLFPFDSQGNEFDPLEVEVEPGNTFSQLALEAFPGVEVSHIGACTSPGLPVSAGYRFTAGDGATAHVAAEARLDNEYLLYPVEPRNAFDGMALINQGGQPALVEAVLLDERGGEVSRVTLFEDPLPPKAKQLSVLDAQFIGLEGAAIRIESSQPATVLFLRGTRPHLTPMLLFQTVPIGVGR